MADVNGRYFFGRRQAWQSRAAQNDKAAQRLWQESERIAGFA